MYSLHKTGRRLKDEETLYHENSRFIIRTESDRRKRHRDDNVFSIYREIN